MTTQRRAKTGGEIGVNGEWYEGGKFIANTDHPKGQPRKAKPRKAEIRPWVWVEAPSADHRAICATIGGIDFKYNHDTGTLHPCQDDIPQHRLDLAEAFNAGRMWCTYDKEKGHLVLID